MSVGTDVITPVGAAAPVKIVERSPTVPELVHESWRQRRLVYWMASRLIVRSYAATRLGRPWLLVRFLLPLTALTAVFGGVAKVPSEGVPYIIYSSVGLLAWQSFGGIVFWATRCLDRYGKFWTNFHLPMLVIPLGVSALTGLEVLTLSFIVVVMSLVYLVTTGTMYLNLGPEMLVGFAGVLMCASFGLCLGLLLSLLNAKARDTFMVLSYGLQGWMLLTPVLYPLTHLPLPLQVLATVNPMTPLVQITKWGILGTDGPTMFGVVYGVVIWAAVVFAGLHLFARQSPWIWRNDLAFFEDEDEEELRASK